MKRHGFIPVKGDVGGSAGPRCRVCNEPQLAHDVVMRPYKVSLLVFAIDNEASVSTVAKDAARVFGRGIEPLGDSEECIGSFKVIGVEEDLHVSPVKGFMGAKS
jgi:hypothetical protein